MPPVQSSRFRHRVNSWRALRAFLDSPADIAEGDVLLGRHTPSGVVTAIMAHPPETESDLRFEAWASAAQQAGRGIKVDLKDPAVVDTVVGVLRAMRFAESGLILNADVTIGPGDTPPRVGLDQLLRLRAEFPAATISVSATTQPDAGPYTSTHIEQLRTAAEAVGPPITVPIRVSLALPNPPVLDGLGDLHITFWNGPESPADTGMEQRLRALSPDAHLDLSLDENR
jgi:hypothetical protein